MKLAPLSRCALLAIGLPALAASAQPAPEDWRVERQEWTWEVSETADVRLSNPWGDIAVRAHRKPEIYLLVNWQHHRDDPSTLELAAEHTPESVALQMGFSERSLESPPADWASRRADVTLFVPEYAVTHFSTAKGRLEVRGTRGPTTVETGGGDIRLRIFGSATAHTEHGGVLAQFRRTDWRRPVEITTTTGPIRVEMPRGGRPDASLETRGEITSDYSMDVERTEGSRLKRVRMKSVAGPSGTTLRLVSYSGPIVIVETLVSEEKDGGTP